MLQYTTITLQSHSHTLYKLTTALKKAVRAYFVYGKKYTTIKRVHSLPSPKEAETTTTITQLLVGIAPCLPRPLVNGLSPTHGMFTG